MFPYSNYQESVVQLYPGDLVVCCTDGVIEARNLQGEEWGVEGLLKATAAWESPASRRVEDLVDSIFSAMDDSSGSCQTDDATVAVTRVRGDSRSDTVLSGSTISHRV